MGTHPPSPSSAPGQRCGSWHQGHLCRRESLDMACSYNIVTLGRAVSHGDARIFSGTPTEKSRTAFLSNGFDSGTLLYGSTFSSSTLQELHSIACFHMWSPGGCVFSPTDCFIALLLFQCTEVLILYLRMATSL